ncbi:MAG: hypothetical protein A3I66_01140 [Burkholderiales bacterium RIFCSPLOWO2_02_FULL_57_36]|nr:MAG: hypothetical protein A3I66_01140 [Burkholderiales bacterium RIFCSPLOWO2_02_FULL_57_36]
MSPELLLVFAAGIFLVAILYSSVGHAGASGYIAIMSLLSLSPAIIKPTALSLNILVASIATVQFVRAGHFSWPLFWPFALLAVPFAFVGGYIDLPAHAFKVIVGIILLYSAARFLFASQTEKPATAPPRIAALAAGAVIGLLSGLTGTGGGIFLTPLLLIMGWAHAKRAAAVSALFILLNSIAGLLGNLSSTKELPSYILPLLAAAGLGGLIGSYIGSRRLAQSGIKRFLAIVLLIAGMKLILT